MLRMANPLGAGIIWFRGLTGASESQVVAAPDDTIQSATAVAFSSAGHSLLVASPAGQTVTALGPRRRDADRHRVCLRAYGRGACGESVSPERIRWRPVVAPGHPARPGADCLRASRAGPRSGTSIWDPTGPHPPPVPPGDSRADRIALASVTAVNKGRLAEVPPGEAGLRAFRAGVYWGWCCHARDSMEFRQIWRSAVWCRALAASACSIRLAARNRRTVGLVSAPSRLRRRILQSPSSSLVSIAAPDRGRPCHEVWSRRRIGVRGRSLKK